MGNYKGSFHVHRQSILWYTIVQEGFGPTTMERYILGPISMVSIIIWLDIVDKVLVTRISKYENEKILQTGSEDN